MAANTQTKPVDLGCERRVAANTQTKPVDLGCERRVAANTQTKPVDLDCESAEIWRLPSTSTIAIVVITRPILILPSHVGWKG